MFENLAEKFAGKPKSNNLAMTPLIKTLFRRPQQFAQVAELPPNRPRPPGNHPNPEGQIDLDELARQFSESMAPDQMCRHMRSRSFLADIIFGVNQHGRWLSCRHCDVRGAIQTLDLMSCVNCSLARIYRPHDDRRKTCVWTRWLTMIARYCFRMTDAEKAVHQGKDFAM